MQETVNGAIALKEALLDFVYDAEGELAVALETYAAERGSKDKYDTKQQNIIVDTFLTDGKVAEKTPSELFIEQQELSQGDRALLERWQERNFTGLFEIKVIADDSLRLMNWLTAKEYLVVTHSTIPTAESDRWQPGEILLTRLAPLDDCWFFFSDRIDKGKLGKPKLAVAVGEFRTKFNSELYGDAPELLEEAWESVAVYHQEFIDFFGGDRLTLPGEELNDKLGELQSRTSQKRLEAAGIDSSKSMRELVRESGADVAEIEAETADLSASDAAAVSDILNSKKKLSSVIPKIDLPPEIKNAERVTVFSHPQWGQMYLPNYLKLTELLATENTEADLTCQYLVRQYLEEPQANYYIWQQLVEEYQTQLEKVLRVVLNDDNFNLDDLPAVLQKYDKPIEPVLPDIASVPLHLNNLFEEAVAQVQKTKSKGKKKKKKKGFL